MLWQRGSFSPSTHGPAAGCNNHVDRWFPSSTAFYQSVRWSKGRFTLKRNEGNSFVDQRDVCRGLKSSQGDGYWPRAVLWLEGSLLENLVLIPILWSSTPKCFVVLRKSRSATNSLLPPTCEATFSAISRISFSQEGEGEKTVFIFQFQLSVGASYTDTDGAFYAEHNHITSQSAFVFKQRSIFPSTAESKLMSQEVAKVS